MEQERSEGDRPVSRDHSPIGQIHRLPHSHGFYESRNGGILVYCARCKDSFPPDAEWAERYLFAERRRIQSRLDKGKISAGQHLDAMNYLDQREYVIQAYLANPPKVELPALPAPQNAGASNLPSVKELRSLASRLRSQANISTRPGQLEELEWISARLLVWANTMERRKDNAMRGVL